MREKQDMSVFSKTAVEAIRNFQLPSYRAIPDVGLYLNQAAAYVDDCLKPLGDLKLTPSMISNYAKEGLIDPPVNKKYYRVQLAYLLFIALIKNVASMKEIRSLKELQEITYSVEEAYNHFNEEMTNALNHLADPKHYAAYEVTGTKTKTSLLHAVMTTAVDKIYMDKYLTLYEQQDDTTSEE